MELTLEDIQELRFVVVNGANPGAVVAFEPEARTIRIGRAIDNDVVINDPTVSRMHASVTVSDQGFTVAENPSSTGVEKMGFRISGTDPLVSGDELRIGDTILRFEVVAKKGALKKAAARESEKAAAAPSAGGKAGAKKAEAARKGPLARIGLDTPVKQIGVAVLVVALAGLALWPTAAELPKQAANVPRGIDYGAVVGFTKGDRSHLDRALFALPGEAEALGLYFELLGPSGVEIRAGKRPIAKTAEKGSWGSFQLLMLTRAVAEGEQLQLSFDNLGYSAKQGNVDPTKVKPWGLQRMRIASITDASSSAAQVAASFDALEALSRRLRDDPANRSNLLAGLRRAAIGLMKLAGRGFVLVELPRPDAVPATDVTQQIAAAKESIVADKPADALDRTLETMRQVEGELEREYRRLSNVLALATKTGGKREQTQALQQITRILPDSSDPRRRIAVSKLRTLGAPVPSSGTP